MPRPPVLKTRHATAVKEGVLSGKFQREIARELGISNGTVADIAPKISSLPSYERKRFYLNIFIRKRGLKMSAEQLETVLRASVEDYTSVRARAVGVKQHQLGWLLSKLPEFKRSRQQILQRKLRDLFETGAPIHNTTYMQAVHGPLLDRATRLFGTYWLSLESIGIHAKPSKTGKPPILRQVKPLGSLRDGILRMRLTGTSKNRIAELHGINLRELERHFERIRDSIESSSDLSRRLAAIDKAEEYARRRELRQPSRDDVLQGLLLGKPIGRIEQETGLTPNQVLAHIYSLNPSEKQRVREAAKKREQVLSLYNRRAQQRKAA